MVCSRGLLYATFFAAFSWSRSDRLLGELGDLVLSGGSGEFRRMLWRERWWV
jgi:hypothetical protein